MLTLPASIISIDDFDKESLLDILAESRKFKEGRFPDLLKGKIMASLFFEPSTRTRLSFESAMLKLGGSVIGFEDGKASSFKKGESLSDTIRVVSSYADIIVLRHPLEGSSQLASKVSTIPVINAGDGANEHPTQTLTDLFTIQEMFPNMNKLSIAIGGDLKYGRTAHSLIKALKYFEPRLYFVCPENLEPPQPVLEGLKENRIKFSFHPDFTDLIPKLDLIYMTRRQEERSAYEGLHNTKLELKTLERAKPTLKIFHPLPRLKELDPLIDKTPYAAYFEQAANGLFVRQAIISRIA